MNECCNRPTYDFATEPYNPTQVRLYGIHRNLQFPGTLVFEDIAISFNPALKSKEEEPEEIEDAPLGVSALPIKTGTGLAFVAALSDMNSDVPLSMGIIYGYAYEGQCYDLPKPKIMILESVPKPIPVDDCGYSLKPGYSVWIVDKLDQCVEIEVNQGFIEQIVLEANLPGRRSPSTYRAQLQVSHRSGRLSD